MLTRLPIVHGGGLSMIVAALGAITVAVECRAFLGGGLIIRGAEASLAPPAGMQLLRTTVKLRRGDAERGEGGVHVDLVAWAVAPATHVLSSGGTVIAVSTFRGPIDDTLAQTLHTPSCVGVAALERSAQPGDCLCAKVAGDGSVKAVPASGRPSRRRRRQGSTH